MTTKAKSIAVVIVFAIIVISMWAGSGALYRVLLKMHGR